MVFLKKYKNYLRTGPKSNAEYPNTSMEHVKQQFIEINSTLVPIFTFCWEYSTHKKFGSRAENSYFFYFGFKFIKLLLHLVLATASIMLDVNYTAVDKIVF